MAKNTYLVMFLVLISVVLVSAKVASSDDSRNNLSKYQDYDNCPLCDSSVYTYCSYKMIHDACCCGGGQYGFVYREQCQFSNCGFIHANSCYEHALIRRCCCEAPY